MCHENVAAFQYLEHLLSIKKKIYAAKSARETDTIWLDIYFGCSKNEKDVMNLPLLLSLIHPDFYTKNGKEFDISSARGEIGDFNRVYASYKKCQSKILYEIDCPFNSNDLFKVEFQADHHWPRSLGGPSVISNRIILCRYHNAMKSNDVTHYSWDKYPDWLDLTLDCIRRIKEMPNDC